MAYSRSKKGKNSSISLTTACDDQQCSIGSSNTSASSNALTTLSSTLSTNAIATLSVTAAQEILNDILKAGNYQNEELTYCLNQLVRAAILCGFYNTTVYRAAATPFLHHYFYQFLKNDNQYQTTETDPTAEAIATTLTTATMVGYDIIYSVIYSDATAAQAALTSTASVATNLATKYATHSSYEWIKNSLFGSTDVAVKTTDEPKSRAWLSVGF